MKDPEIPLSEYATRRKKLLGAIKKGVGLVFAGESDGHGPFRPHRHFEYLTGVIDEPGAILILDGAAPAARREVLLLKPRDPEVEAWDGLRLPIASELRQRVGIAAIFRTGMLPRLLNEAVLRSKRVVCLHPFATFDQPVSRDFALYKDVSARIPGVTIEDGAELIVKQRAIKSANEVKMIQRAVDLTAVGFDRVLGTMAPGMHEHEIQELLENTYKREGMRRGTSYDTIVGGGLMATVLHYRANERELQDGDLVCIDSGGTFGGYTADVTRTLPVNGQFSKRQKEIYNLVLRALEAANKAVKPGATMGDVDGAARKIIEKAGFGDRFFHGIGHQLGMEVHDVTPKGPLQAGMVITVEPGVYLPDENLGVRIEDDVLVTKDGHRVLTRAIPKKVADIEKRMAARDA